MANHSKARTEAEARFRKTLKRFPLELNRWDSHGFRDGRVFRH